MTSREQWRTWLGEHHATSPGVWLVTWKKSRGPYLSYDDVVDEAICFGLVDSQPKSLDDTRSQRLLTPASPKAAGHVSTSSGVSG